MKCKVKNEPQEQCIDASWTTKQSRTLNSYRKTGNTNAFNKHLEWIKGLGYEVNYITWNGGGGGFRVEEPNIRYW